MNQLEFNNCINDIFNEKKIENRNISNIDILKSVVNDKSINDSLYKGFINNYENEYGNDESNLLMKLQDMVYRLHLLINYNIIDKYNLKDNNIIKDALEQLITNNTIDLYDAVSYDDSEYEIIENQELDVRDALALKKI